MKTIIKILTISFILLLSTTLASNLSLASYNDIILIPGTPQLYKIPNNLQYKSIKIIQHTFDQIPADVPFSTFYTQNNLSPNLPVPEVVYTTPFQHEFLKKGRETFVRLFAPNKYYKDNKEYTTNDIIVRITFDELSPPFAPTYGPQATTYDYVIITDSDMWNLFNDEYKDWKITNDIKVDSILISNASNIILNSTFWVNGTFGDATNATHGNPWMPDGKEITNNWSMFNDTPAKIRNFIRSCVTNYSTQYILLGGSKDAVPPRMVASRAYGAGCGGAADNDLSHASDMYYGCLDFCMNNNTNSYFMENPACSNDYDEVDLGFDAVVGRALGNNKTAVWNWINKTKSYADGTSQGNYLGNHIQASKDTGNNIDNSVWLMIGDEFPSNTTFLNNMNISQAQWILMNDYVNGNYSNWDGFHIIYHTGHGGTLYSTEGGVYRPGLCSNNLTPNFVYTEGCHTADFGTDINSRMERWIEYPICAFGGIANSAYGWFVASTYFGEEMLRQMFNSTCGNFTKSFAQAHNDAREITGYYTADGVWSMIYKETNFFGDPALEYVWYEGGSSPNISINYAGSYISGGPYYLPPDESMAASDGYYTNDSHQQEDYMYIFLNITDTEGVDEVWLHWLNGTTWTNNSYQFANVGGTFWAYNTSDNITTYPNCSYSFDVWANDTFNNNATVHWNKTAVGGAYTRRYVQLNHTTVNISYTPYYFYDATYTASDYSKADRLHHDQGPEGTLTDTGFLLDDIPTATVNNRRCTIFTGYWFDESVPTASFNLSNIYYHFWWSTDDDILEVGWNKTKDYLNADTTNSYTTSAANNRSSIYYDGPAPNDLYYLDTHFLNTTNTPFTDNSIYEFDIAFAEWEARPSIISNRSFTSFILLNIPNNTTLAGLDSDSDGLNDYNELWENYTNPFLSDTDNDGYDDELEISYSTDPNNYTSQPDINVPEFVYINGGLNGTMIYSSNPTFNWTRTTNTSHYWLQISNTSTFSTLTINITNISAATYPAYYTQNTTRVSFMLPPYYILSNYNIYYTRVRAYEKN